MWLGGDARKVPKKRPCSGRCRRFEIVNGKFNLPPVRAPCAFCDKSAEFYVKKVRAMRDPGNGRTRARVDMFVHNAREILLDFAGRIC